MRAVDQPIAALLFEDGFDAIKPVWNFGKGDWKVEDGTVRGAERAEDHHQAGLAHTVKFRDGAARLVFKFDGAKAIEMALIKKDEAGARIHVGRISFTPEAIRIYAQTGMGPTTKYMLIAETPAKFVAGKWSTALIEFVGDELAVQLDTREDARGKDPLLAVEKASLTLTVGGTSGVFNDFKLWAAA